MMSCPRACQKDSCTPSSVEISEQAAGNKSTSTSQQNTSRNAHMRVETHLMSHVVLHVHMAAAKNFQTKGTKQVFSVFMDCAKVVVHIGEEGGPVVTNLRKSKNKVKTKDLKYKTVKNKNKALPDSHRASLQACDCPSYAPEALARSQKPVHIFYSWLKIHVKPQTSGEISSFQLNQ